MRSRTPALLAGLFALGLLLIALGIFLGTDKNLTLNKSDLSMRVIPISGQVSVHNSAGKIQVLRTETQLTKAHTFSTDSQGEAQIFLSDGSELLLKPESRVGIDLEENSLSLKRGDLEVMSVQSKKKWTLSLTSKKFWLEDFSLGKLSSSEVLNATSTPQAQNLAAKNIILNAIQRQRSSFFKCYSQKLVREPETSKVQALVGITIQPSGKITKMKVISITPQDSTFENCLLQVMERLQLPSFSGSTIETAVPFEFE